MITQRADYTFKYNRRLGRHGWLRLTPAYSVKLVREIIAQLHQGSHILDPFSGTATTGIVAGEYGHPSSLFDINPFLVWLGNVKLQTLTYEQAAELRRIVREITDYAQSVQRDELRYPQISNIERWWDSETLENLAKLRESLSMLIQEPRESSCYAPLWVAFARVAIEHSAAAFNHVSVSFQQVAKPHSLHRILFSFASFAESFINDALSPFNSDSRVYLRDSSEPLPPGFSFDAIVTSPPYPNRISYIRELRPYMFWLGFLTEPREAGELDWQAIGGTWGIATSRLAKWSPSHDCQMQTLAPIVRNIRESGGPNCELLSVYVSKYFHDIDRHIASIKTALNDNSEIHYVIGNSTFYGIHVPTPELYMESLRSRGFVKVNSRPLRKRNSKRELFEYCVSARLARQS